MNNHEDQSKAKYITDSNKGIYSWWLIHIPEKGVLMFGNRKTEASRGSFQEYLRTNNRAVGGSLWFPSLKHHKQCLIGYQGMDLTARVAAGPRHPKELRRFLFLNNLNDWALESQRRTNHHIFSHTAKPKIRKGYGGKWEGGEGGNLGHSKDELGILPILYIYKAMMRHGWYYLWVSPPSK